MLSFPVVVFIHLPQSSQLVVCVWYQFRTVHGSLCSNVSAMFELFCWLRCCSRNGRCREPRNDWNDNDTNDNDTGCWHNVPCLVILSVGLTTCSSFVGAVDWLGWQSVSGSELLLHLRYTPVACVIWEDNATLQSQLPILRKFTFISSRKNDLRKNWEKNL